MTNAYITGWGHTVFGKLDQVDLEQLIRDAVQPALESAGLEPKDIDGIFVGHFNAGFVGQDFTAALPAVAMPELRHTPSVRSENACATGSAAIWAALDAMAAAICENVNRACAVPASAFQRFGDVRVLALGRDQKDRAGRRQRGIADDLEWRGRPRDSAREGLMEVAQQRGHRKGATRPHSDHTRLAGSADGGHQPPHVALAGPQGGAVCLRELLQFCLVVRQHLG
jgi:acetyl-CoA acetyltransferase